MNIHPSLRKEPLQQCLGFTKDHRRCRLERQHDKKTCFIHRNYYIQWIEKNLPLLKYFNFELLTPRIKKEIEFQLKFHYVSITKEDIVREFWNLTNTDGFEKLILYHCIDPFWCPRLFERIIDKHIYGILYGEFLTVRQVMQYNTLLKSFTSIHILEYVFRYIHYLCIYVTYCDQEQHTLHELHKKFQTIWNVTLSSDAWKPFLYIPMNVKTYLLEKKPYLLSKINQYITENEFNQCFESYMLFVTTILNERFNIEKKLQKHKSLLKDELIYTTTEKNWRVISCKK